MRHFTSVPKQVRVRGALRSPNGLPRAYLNDVGDHLSAGFDARDQQSITALVDEFGPDVVINAVGVIKQAPLVQNKLLTAEVNGALPHFLASECSRVGARLVHISTDCVFSGQRGGYTEDDVPDPVDFCGRSKLLGEVDDRGLCKLPSSPSFSKFLQCTGAGSPAAL